MTVANNETIGLSERGRGSGAGGQRVIQIHSTAAASQRAHESSWRQWPPALPCGYEVVSSEQPPRVPFRKF
jgi:hypothetical protein